LRGGGPLPVFQAAFPNGASFTFNLWHNTSLEKEVSERGENGKEILSAKA
jgi:hypothetical protein